MTAKSEFLTDLVETYLYDADGWDESDVRRKAGDFYAENADASSVDDDELLDLAEEAYSRRSDWPDCKSIRDGIAYLAAEALSGEFHTAVAEAISDFGDFDALYKVHPFKGQDPDVVDYDTDVSVFWDEDHHVAIKTVFYNDTKFYLDVSSEYELEEDALLLLRRSAHGQEDGGGGEEEAA